MKIENLKIIKENISDFLNQKLFFTLLDKKASIKHLIVTPALFLGFEIRMSERPNIKRRWIFEKLNGKVLVSATTTRNKVFARIDKQKLIDVLYLKSYCDKQGFPREKTKLNNLEAFTIIEITNNVLRKLTDYYVRSIRSPKSELSRWIYIIRFSCLKTLALKYKITLKEIFNKFKPKFNDLEQSATIENTITIEINNECFSKTCRLNTIQSLMKKYRSKVND